MMKKWTDITFKRLCLTDGRNQRKKQSHSFLVFAKFHVVWLPFVLFAILLSHPRTESDSSSSQEKY